MPTNSPSRSRKSLPDRSEPKYRAIREEIRRAITDGTYAAGQRLPAEEELGARYDASRNTVIRALVDLRNEGLLQRVQGAGTFVAKQAQGGREVFAFIAGGGIDYWTRNTVFGRLELMIGKRLHERQAGAWLLPDLRVERDEGERHRAEAVERACAQGAVGVFFLPMERLNLAHDANRRFVDQLKAAGVATVLLDQDIEPSPRRSELDLVALDNLSAGASVGEHLLAQGCRKFMFVMPPNQPETVRQRLAGLKTVVEAAGAEVRELRVNDAAAIRTALRASKCDAVVGKDDSTSAAVMRVLYELGRRVPDEVKLAGFDDSPLAQELTVPLTTYAQPVEAIADAAVHLMLTRLENPAQPPRQVIVSGKLVVRRSTSASH